MGMAMSKYARPVDHGGKGSDIRMLDVFDPSIYSPRPSWGQTDAELMDRIFENHKQEWTDAGQWFVEVHESVIDGARFAGGDYMKAGNFENPAPVVDAPAEPKPNTPNNPYFGKPTLATKDFWALVGKVLPADRFKRLINDSHFLWIDKVLDKVETVDPDDKAGQFLQIVTYLTATNGDDAAPLLKAGERDSIMAAWS